MKIRPDPVPVLDAVLEAELLDALRPVDPSPLRAAALRARLLAEVAAGQAAGEFVTILRGQGTWRNVAPGVALKPLVDRPGMRAFLVKMDAGASLPPHDHPTNEESVVLEGEVWLGDVLCHAGDFHLAPAGRRHGSLRTETGCLVYVRTGGGKGTALL